MLGAEVLPELDEDELDEELELGSGSGGVSSVVDAPPHASNRPVKAKQAAIFDDVVAHRILDSNIVVSVAPQNYPIVELVSPRFLDSCHGLEDYIYDISAVKRTTGACCPQFHMYRVAGLIPATTVGTAQGIHTIDLCPATLGDFGRAFDIFQPDYRRIT